MARFPSIDNNGAFESPQVQDQIKQLVTGSTDGITVDTSVGTRVFVGDTMIHGDTGWRDISNLLHEDWELAAAGHFKIRRENNTITLVSRIQRTAESPSKSASVSSVDLLIGTGSPLPQGFVPYPFYGAYAYASTKNGYPLEFHAYGTMRNLRIRSDQGSGDWEPGDSLLIQTSWQTNDSWPTSLPGTPA